MQSYKRFLKEKGINLKKECPYVREINIGSGWTDPSGDKYKAVEFKKLNGFSLKLESNGIVTTLTDYTVLVIKKIKHMCDDDPSSSRCIENGDDLTPEKRQQYLNAYNKYGGIPTEEYFLKDVGYIGSFLDGQLIDGNPLHGKFIERATSIKLY